MESEFGCFFLSNYRAADLSACISGVRLSPPGNPSSGQDRETERDKDVQGSFPKTPRSPQTPEPSILDHGQSEVVHKPVQGVGEVTGSERSTKVMPAEKRLQAPPKGATQSPASESPQGGMQGAQPARVLEEFPALPRAAAAAAAASEALKQSTGFDGLECKSKLHNEKPGEKKVIESAVAGSRRRSSQASGSSQTPNTPTVQETSVVEMDDEVTQHLEAFFADEASWQMLQTQLKKDLTAGLSQRIANLHVNLFMSEFKVSVPKPYPGVQYRKSKDLEERYSRYAENGTTVFGQLEADGQWLRISGNIFLPVRVGQIHILDEADEVKESRQLSQLDTKLVPDGKEEVPDGWLLCCPSNAKQEVAAAQAGGVALEKAAKPMRSEQKCS
ncbi:unnamed protein product [Symbiodinium natans]|uniref:Uncharacterized protein n=1 Tax=Symbiodinium natans TaxID=878477 RepID=A0A812PAW5_9DINO|nr:unnamed protein product [Symbiodinium natans]